MKPTVFIHTNPKQVVGALVSAHSLRRNSTHAAEFDGLVDAQEAGIAQLLEDLVGGEDFVFFPFVDMWIDVLVDDGPQSAADLGVFRRELHGDLLSCRTAGLQARIMIMSGPGGPRSGKKPHRLPSRGKVPMSLEMICSMTSSAPPPIEPKRPSR